MPEKDKHILHQAIQQLPSWEAADRIWDKINEELDYEAEETQRGNLQHAIGLLSVSEAPAAAWENIEKQLEEISIKKNKRAPSYYFRIAASVMLIVALSILAKNIFFHTISGEKIEYSEEIAFETTNEKTEESDIKLSKWIKEQCQLQPGMCTKEEFTELNTELVDLDKCLDKMKNANINDPEIYKYTLKIQKERTKILKKIFQFFNNR